MTPELKAKIKASMTEYLVGHGYPDNLPSQAILQNHMPNLWNKLASEGLLTDLIAKGFDFNKFVQIAITKKNEADVMAEVERHFNFHRK